MENQAFQTRPKGAEYLEITGCGFGAGGGPFKSHRLASNRVSSTATAARRVLYVNDVRN